MLEKENPFKWDWIGNSPKIEDVVKFIQTQLGKDKADLMNVPKIKELATRQPAFARAVEFTRYTIW